MGNCDINFSLEGGMMHMVAQKPQQQYTDVFLQNIVKFQDIIRTIEGKSPRRVRHRVGSAPGWAPGWGRTSAPASLPRPHPDVLQLGVGVLSRFSLTARKKFRDVFKQIRRTLEGKCPAFLNVLV